MTGSSAAASVRLRRETASGTRAVCRGPPALCDADAMSTSYAWLDATAQAELVAAGETTPLELVDAAIARVEALNPPLNAVIHKRFERARDEARALPDSDSPLRGVP